MQGLRTQENSDFIRFFEMVQNEAHKHKSVFFLDCEEGDDGIVGNTQVCRLSGWLIPQNRASEFESVWKKEMEDDTWADFFCFVDWKDEDGLKITFD